MVNKFKALLATALIAASLSAQAGVITMTRGEGVSDPSHTENFEGGTTGNNITDQFSANGLTFETLGAAGMTLTNNNVCSNSGMSGKYLSFGQRFPCNINSAYNSASLMFNGIVNEVSWTGFNRAIGNGFIIQFLNNGQGVGDVMFTQSGEIGRFDNQILRFSGAAFDQIIFSENGTGQQGFFGIDNMAWKMAPAVVNPPISDVPEPSIALLFGMGMVGMGFMRKKKATV
jgi:hypothetical protein